MSFLLKTFIFVPTKVYSGKDNVESIFQYITYENIDCLRHENFSMYT